MSGESGDLQSELPDGQGEPAAEGESPPEENRRQSGKRSSRRWWHRRPVRWAAIFLVLWALLALTLPFRPPPTGTHVTGPWRAAAQEDLSFLADLTWRDRSDRRILEQEIFDEVFAMIGDADAFLVVDFFLINDFAGDPSAAPRALSGELVGALLAARRRHPEMPILLVTDPINRVYGGEFHPGLERLEAAGVDVVETDLDVLRDSNPTWSALYRTLFRWLGNEAGGGALPNPFLAEDETTLRSWLRLLNFKANHRKSVVAGRSGAPPRGLVTSGNPHDASSAHWNVALAFEGAAALDLAATELAVARFSGWNGEEAARLEAELDAARARLDPPESSATRIRVLTEGAVRDALLAGIGELGAGDRLDLAMFYLGHRGVVEALLDAAGRGTEVRLLLDANRDAFGRTKDGVPNRPVAHELVSASNQRARRDEATRPIEVRWVATHGEQFHTKLALLRGAGETSLILGSANLTRRNIDDFNLETDVEARMPPGAPLEAEVAAMLERIWTNGRSAESESTEPADLDGLYSVPYEEFEDSSWWSAVRARVMERTGLSTF